MKEIPLTRGKVAIVDDEDYDGLARHKWCATLHDGKWYATRQAGGRLNRHSIYMHRQILNPSPGLTTDHRNGDGLDNRRRNLREATSGQQQYNKPRPRHNTSGYKGVQVGRNGHGWQANIRVNKRAIYLGQFQTKEEAAAVYAAAAIRYHGDFAHSSMKGQV